jgi:hypothetical protein
MRSPFQYFLAMSSDEDDNQNDKASWKRNSEHQRLLEQNQRTVGCLFFQEQCLIREIARALRNRHFA